MFFTNKLFITNNSLSINKQELNISLIELLNNKSKQTELSQHIKFKKTNLIIDETILTDKNISIETLLNVFEKFGVNLSKITSKNGSVLFKKPFNTKQPLKLIFILSLVLCIMLLDYKISHRTILLTNSEKQLKVNKTLSTLNTSYKSNKNEKISQFFELIINSPIIIDSLSYVSPNTITLHYYSKDDNALQHLSTKLQSNTQSKIIESYSFGNKYEQKFSL